MWSLSLGLVMCLVSVLPAYFDHGERKKAFATASNSRDKWVSGLKWILINWGLPVLAFSVTIAQGFESAATDRELSVTTNELAKLESKVASQSNTLTAAKPESQPIQTMTANASIWLRGTNFPDQISIQGVSLWGFKNQNVGHGGGRGSFALTATSSKKIMEAFGSTAIELNFKMDNQSFNIGHPKEKVTTLGECNVLELIFSTLGGDAELVRGSVEVIVNSTVSRVYRFAPQRTSEGQFTTIETNGQFQVFPISMDGLDPISTKSP